MSLTRQRITFLARILGEPVLFDEERYWTFPRPDVLCTLNGSYLRHRRFGWRSDWVATTARHIVKALGNGGVARDVPLERWREIADQLRRIPRTGVGPKVGGCIDLFSLDRLHAVPVDTWVLKLAREWYGVEGGEPRVRAWAEQRGGRWAGYMNEYLFAYYRELNATSPHDRVITFCASDLPSPDLPFERV
jgi:N-glycosylase/DNA lyase